MMLEEISEELQKKFVDVADNYIYKTIMNSKQKYERNERKIKSQLILNQICNQYGDELIDTLIGAEDVECNWDFLDTVEDKKLFIALKSLNTRQLHVLKLKFVDNCSNAEINQLMGYKRRSSSYDYINYILRKIRLSMSRKENPNERI